jgi:hypothetical protein
MRDFIASVLFSLIIGIVAMALLTNSGRADGSFEFRVEVGMAQATAVPPTPTPQPTPTAWATAVAPIVPPAPTGRAGMYATPYQLHGDRLTYCHNPAHQWTAEERAITAAGFEAWTPAGLSFHEVAYSPRPTECLISVEASADYGDIAVGRARVAAGGLRYQSRIWSNLALMPHNLDVVMHEIGHVLGLDHAPTGVMTYYLLIGLRPEAADFQGVRAYWFGEE